MLAEAQCHCIIENRSKLSSLFKEEAAYVPLLTLITEHRNLIYWACILRRRKLNLVLPGSGRKASIS